MPSPLDRWIRQSKKPIRQYNAFSGLVRTTDATELPITLDEAKRHLWLEDADADDIYIVELIKAARLIIEDHINRSIMTQHWQLVLDTWPSNDYIDLPRGPVQSVTTIKTYDEDDAETTFSSTNYFVDTVNDRVSLNLGNTWPTDLRPYNAIIIDYKTGYSNVDKIPGGIRIAIKILLSYLYDNRSTVTTDNIKELPMNLNAILEPYKIKRL